MSRTVPANADESHDPSAAASLAFLMSELSEEHYCASWLSDCEHELWGMLTEPNRAHRWGMGEIESASLRELQRLSDACGGWIRWRSAGGGEWFIPIAEWTERHAAYERKLAAWAKEHAAQGAQS